MLLLTWVLISTPALDRAEAALTEFDAEATLAALELVKAEGPLKLQDHIRYYAYAGIAHAYLEQEPQSLAAFAELLQLDPGHVIPYTLSPRVTFLFQQARKRAPPAPAVDFSWPRDRQVGDALPVVVEVLRDPELRLAYARLSWRDDAQAPFRETRVQLVRPGSFATVELPADEGPQADVTRQLFLTLFDAAGNELSRLGDASQPREVTLRYVPPTPWYETWWIWASVGVVVAAGAATAVYLGTRPEPEDVSFGVEVVRP